MAVLGRADRRRHHRRRRLSLDQRDARGRSDGQLAVNQQHAQKRTAGLEPAVLIQKTLTTRFD
jgi:hypothetical protein